MNASLRVDDYVLIRNNGNKVFRVTKILHDKAQLDGKKWVRLDEVTLSNSPNGIGENNTKQPLLTSDEYIDILAKIGYKFAMSELDNRIYVNGEPIDDMLAATIRAAMRDLGHLYITAIEDAYAAYAMAHSFHVVKDYLHGLKWNGEENIARVASFFTDRDNVFYFFFRRWLIGAVAKVFSAAQNPMLVLDGAQDAGKSFFVRWLASGLPGMHIEGPIRPDNKDDLTSLVSMWIWEVAELGSTTRRSDREALKHFLTSERVTIRTPYARHAVTKPALASFIGTVNSEGGGILDDPTGNRRFVVVDVLGIDWDYVQIDVNQVWAEAFAAYQAGEEWRLQDEERQLSRQINDRYQIQDPLEDMITQLYEIDPTRLDWVMPTNNILDALHLMGWRLQSPRAEAMALATALRKTDAIKPDNKITDPATGQQVRGYYGMRRRLTNQPQPTN